MVHFAATRDGLLATTMASIAASIAAADPLSEVVVAEDVNGLCDAFERVFGSEVLCSNDKDVAVEGARAKLREKRLEMPYDFGDEKETAPTVICEHTSQFKGCRIFIDEQSDTNRVYIVETDAVAFEFLKRGFKEYLKVSIPDISMIPEKTRLPGTEIDIFERPVPNIVELPDKIPTQRRGDSLAKTVVEQFEDKVLDVENDKVYAPIRLWTKETRSGVSKKVSGTLYNRLLCYYAIKTVHVNATVEELAAMNQKKLVDDAKYHAKGANPQTTMNADFWFDACVGIYNSRMDTSE